MGSTEELPLLQLPDRVLLLITELLVQQDKLSLRALARTNSKLQQLALPALSASICSTLATKKQLKSLQRYLQAHGHLTSRLSLQGRPAERKISHDDYGSHGVCGLGAPHIKALPDAVQPRLEALAISCLRVAPGKFLTPGLTSLQELNISDCIVTDGDDTLEAGLLAVAPSLRGLTIQRLFEHRGLMQLYSVPFPNAALPALTALTSLQLTGSVRSTAGLSGLVELRDLVLQSDGGIDVAEDDLPASDKLTRLVLHNFVDPSVQDLPLLDPAALSRVPALRHLVLSTYIQEYDEPSEGGGTAGLLQALGNLTQLTLLGLEKGTLEDPLEPAAAAAYASLTASSALQTLSIEEAQLPDGAWGHVFGHGRQLPQLKCVWLEKAPWFDHSWYPVSEEVYKAGAMSAADLAALAACCPGLTALQIKGVRQQEGAPLAPMLRQLTALQILYVDGASDADAAVLAQQLSGLQRLRLECSPGLTAAGVQGLTKLTGLVELRVDVEAEDEGEDGDSELAGDMCFRNQAPAGTPPDVWSQLAEDCERRKDPAAYRAWEKAESKALMDRLLGRHRGAGGGSISGGAEAAAAGVGTEGPAEPQAGVQGEGEDAGGADEGEDDGSGGSSDTESSDSSVDEAQAAMDQVMGLLASGNVQVVTRDSSPSAFFFG